MCNASQIPCFVDHSRPFCGDASSDGPSHKQLHVCTHSFLRLWAAAAPSSPLLSDPPISGIMYIEEVIIDGFKSYSTRVTVGPFDRQFNAITGQIRASPWSLRAVVDGKNLA